MVSQVHQRPLGLGDGGPMALDHPPAHRGPIGSRVIGLEPLASASHDLEVGGVPVDPRAQRRHICPHLDVDEQHAVAEERRCRDRVVLIVVEPPDETRRGISGRIHMSDAFDEPRHCGVIERREGASGVEVGNLHLSRLLLGGAPHSAHEPR